MFSELQQPAYQHVLLNHWPIIGSAAGALGLVVGLLLRNRAAVIPSLIVLIAAGLSAWPVYQTGSSAYKPIRKIVDTAGADWLDEHMDRADRTVWTFYATAGLAALALLVPLKFPRSAAPLALATLLAAVIAVGAGAYIAEPGGRIRHTEFRPGATATSGSGAILEPGN